MVFRDRAEAGSILADALTQYRDATDTVVIALPRGGVVVGAAVAAALHLPLDIIVPRKIGAPHNAEYAIGAITESGEPVWDTQAVHLTDASDEFCAAAVARERTEAQRRLALYRASRPPRNVHGNTVILVDDGIATGLTIRAAIVTLRAEGARRIVVAAPVAAADTIVRVRQEADDTVIHHATPDFAAVGQFYASFDQTTDSEVITLLRAAQGDA